MHFLELKYFDIDLNSTGVCWGFDCQKGSLDSGNGFGTEHARNHFLNQWWLSLLTQKCTIRPGPRFTNGFSIAIQIRWKVRFTLISILIQWSLQNFVHGTTAVLSWHVQKFVAIWWPATELQQGEVSIEFELRAKKTLVKRAPGELRNKDTGAFYITSSAIMTCLMLYGRSPFPKHICRI